jgi:hypothetical protein
LSYAFTNRKDEKCNKEWNEEYDQECDQEYDQECDEIMPHHIPQAYMMHRHMPAPAQSIQAAHIIRSFAEKPGKIYLLYGDPFVFNLSLRMAAQAMAQGSSIAVVDGCNRFDVHALTRFARERRIDPNKFLRHIYISRGFTCYQMEQAITNKLPAFLAKIDSRTAMIFGLLETFYDEQAPLREVQQILGRVAERLQQMKSKGLSILIVCLERTVAPKERNRLFLRLKSSVDRVYKLDADAAGSPQVFLEAEKPTNKTSSLKTGRA